MASSALAAASARASAASAHARDLVPSGSTTTTRATTTPTTSWSRWARPPAARRLRSAASPLASRASASSAFVSRRSRVRRRELRDVELVRARRPRLRREAEGRGETLAGRTACRIRRGVRRRRAHLVDLPRDQPSLRRRPSQQQRRPRGSGRPPAASVNRRVDHLARRRRRGALRRQRIVFAGQSRDACLLHERLHRRLGVCSRGKSARTKKFREFGAGASRVRADAGVQVNLLRSAPPSPTVSPSPPPRRAGQLSSRSAALWSACVTARTPPPCPVRSRFSRRPSSRALVGRIVALRPRRQSRARAHRTSPPRAAGAA